jgi:hypothetical protein
MTRKQSIDASRANKDVGSNPPLLSEGVEYAIELCASETVVLAILLRVVDDAPLGRGFQLSTANQAVVRL